MGSLRVRLVLGLVLLAAAGLVAVGGITYVEQRSFLLDRADQQAQSAVAAVSQALDTAGFGQGDHGHDGGPHRGPDGGVASLPPGTYGQRRTSDGRVLGHVVFLYGQTPLAAPSIPRRITPGQLSTVASIKDNGPSYRLFAQTDPDTSATTIVAIPLTDVDQALHRLLMVESIVIAAVLAALALLALLVVRVGLRPLGRMEVVAGAIAAGEFSTRVAPATERTEVGRLGLALNRMLDRLQEAFMARQASEDRLRQFLADASHELRTPLASIRGYAELFRMGAATKPADIDRAMRGIESEAARMGVLVEDLLALARLDAVREPVTEPVDLARLTSDAVDAARVRAPSREITLTTEPARTTGDPHQLRQVLDNLLRNAITHTPDTTPIEVHLHNTGGESRLEVRDHGPGLPPGDPQELFERFWRAEAGRGRGRAGAGLGLAIAKAITDAHHGHISAHNTADGGASFIVMLPAAGPRETPTTR